MAALLVLVVFVLLVAVWAWRWDRVLLPRARRGIESHGRKRVGW
jgi:hypothetical protein